MAAENEIEGVEPADGNATRPALVALVIVVTVAIMMIAASALVLKETCERASEMVESSLSSVVIIDDVRNHLTRLASEPDGKRAELERSIATALESYAPLATVPGEAEELARFNVALKRFLASPRGVGEREARFDQAYDSLARLSEINAHAAHDTIGWIEAAHRRSLVVLAVSGAIILGAAGVVAMGLLRVMRRQRVSVERDLAWLRERNRDLAEFAGRTAHDLRAPLTPIRGYADLLAAGVQVDVGQAARRIQRATGLMSELIEDLLELSTSGHPPPGETDVEPVAREVLGDLARELADADVQLSVADVRVAAAPSVLRRLLRNVIENSSKYRAPDRRLAVRVEAKRLDSNVELVVEDNGRGMPPGAAAHAFDTYFRAPNARMQPGSGLGLSIVKRTLEALGGGCELNSELNRGTRITMRLPVAAA